MPPRRRPANDRRGFALIAALWLLVALASLGVELSLQARSRHLAAANVLEGAQAGGAAIGGVEQARARLTQLAGTDAPTAVDVVDPWHDPSRVLAETLTVGTALARVSLADANASLNVNRASVDELRRLFVALRIDAGDADRLAQSIVDWRDPDDLPLPRGGERELYLREGRAVLPSNAPFGRLEELRDVRGMPAVTYERVRPYLTVAGTGQVNLNAAALPVLLALDGMTEEVAQTLERAREAGRPIRSLQELQLALSAGARAAMQSALPALYGRAVFETREVEVTSDGWTVSGLVHARATGLLVRAGHAVFLVGRRNQ